MRVLVVTAILQLFPALGLSPQWQIPRTVRVPARLNLPRAEHGMTVRRLGRCRAEHRLAERLGGGDGAAEAKQERYAALPLPSPPPRALDRLPGGCVEPASHYGGGDEA